MIKIMDNIILLGTSHVSLKSKKEIESTIEKYKPEVVGIELDLSRFKSLMSKNKVRNKPSFYNMVQQFGVSGALFGLVAGYAQKTIGKKLNIDPGLDMKTAYLKSREKSIPTSLIDQDIRITLRKLSNLPIHKKVKMFGGLLFKSMKKEYKQKLKFDVKKGVPDEKIISELLNVVKKEVPDLYNILIEDRNKFMVKKLLKLKERHSGYILAVVGAGHVEGMYKLLEKKLPKNRDTTILEHKFIIEI